MTELADRDYFTDHDILVDPYAYFEAVRGKGRVYQPKGKDYLMVMGFEETLEIMRNSEDFSAIIGLQGASAPLPFTPHGPDINLRRPAGCPRLPACRDCDMGATIPTVFI